ncbi:hypothetical protein Tco_0158067 [Tanacetum coccineum]
MATMAENVIAAGSETRPSMLEKGMYDSWKTRIMLYTRGKENGEMLRDSIKNGHVELLPEITVKDTYGVTDIRLDIYTLINHYQTAKEIWDRVKELMEGTEMTKQERESMLYDEFDKFTSEPGESIHSYYLRFTKLINDINMNPMSMRPMQINTKFVNHLQPEWSRFVTAAKQARNLHSITFDQFYAPIVVQQPPTFQPDTGLAIPTFLPTDDPIASLNKAMIFLSSMYRRQSQGYTGNAGNNQASGAWVINAVGNTGLQATTNFKADHVDAYDSDYDDEAIANAIFMANLYPGGSLNDDTVAPRYDSNTLFEVPHYDTYYDSVMLNSNIQELRYIENIISNNESYDELKGNSDVISYTDYMLTIRNDEDNYVPPPVQKNDMMLFVIEQMKSQVEKCNKVKQDAKSMNESLTSELERYKDRVRVLAYTVKDGHSEQEAYLGRELYTSISQRKRQVSEFEKQVFSQ